MKRRALLWVLLSASAFGQTLIYSNLNSDPTNVYDCCNGYQMSNPNQSAIAVPFVVPKGVHHFAHAVVAFQWTNYDGGGIWVLDSDDSGLPGPALTQVTWSALPEVDTCCVTKRTPNRSDHQNHQVKLVPGRRYWVQLVTGRGQIVDQWPYNTTAATGNYAVSTAQGWQLQNGTVPAIAIYGKK